MGATPFLIWPVGSSVGLTDSIPIAAVFFKLFDAWLPPVFQYIGLWLVSCFALQGVFGALLAELATKRPVLQFLAALLFVLSPPLIHRFGHAALSAHWLILAALWLYLQPGAGVPSHRRALGWAVLMLLAAAIQPYLLLMVAVVMGAAYLRQLLCDPRQLALLAGHGALGLLGAWIGLWQSGSFIIPSEGGLAMGGFGAYSANLLTFVMPIEANTRLAPGPIPYADRLQYEGYAYLGAGTLLLGIVALAAATTLRPAEGARRERWFILPLLLGLAFLTLMALGPAITAGPYTLATYEARWWGPFTIFRSSGRMIWPAYYALITAIVFVVARFKYRTALLLMSVALAVQVIDLAGMKDYVGQVQVFGFRDPLGSRLWSAATPNYQRLVLYPSNLCGRNGAIDYLPFSLLAARHRIPINAGSTARYDVPRAAAYCAQLEKEILAGMTTPDTLYVVRRDLLPGVLSSEPSDTRPICTEADGFGVCFSRESYERWRADFEATPLTP